jgi:hypothetical protein
VEKVVLVVDESVSFESFRRLVAPRLTKFPRKDFGEAAATANCSASSNALLRWGVERQRVHAGDYDPRTNPTIWGYARAAGFHTVLIDGQSTGEIQNYISPKEFELIDEFVPAKHEEGTDLDIARALNARLAAPGKEFIYIVKRGAHFPYAMDYPRNRLPDSAPTLRKYDAAVDFATGGFFDALSRGLPFGKLLMIYTSDHGQDLARRPAHCNADPGPDEYSVPLVVISAAPEATARLATAELSDHASHLNIFPTILEAFGYAPEWVTATYGPSLEGPRSDYLTYVHRAWQPQTRLRERHTVRPNAFAESTGFPRRR